MVVLTNATITKQVEINEYCRSNGIYFTAADVRGLFGLVDAIVLASIAEPSDRSSMTLERALHVSIQLASNPRMEWSSRLKRLVKPDLTWDPY